MTTLTETLHRAAFLVSWDDDGFYNVETGTVTSGQVLKAGQAVKVASNKLVAWAGSGTIVGLMLGSCDATGGDVKAQAYIARGPVEVRAADLPDNDGTNNAALATGLAALVPPIVQR